MIRMVERMSDRPSGSIPETFETHAEAKAAYRALSSEAVDAQALRDAVHQACVGRLGEERLVLAVQDTTSFDFTSHPATEGLGPLAHAKCSGFWVHSTLCVSANGVPLGLIDQKVWARDGATVGKRHRRKSLPIEEKESYRWIESLRAVHEAAPSETTVVTVADREADIFEVFAEARPGNGELLIRACRNRRVAGARKLWEVVEEQAPRDTMAFSVRAGADRPARDVVAELRFCKVTLKPPTGGVHAPCTVAFTELDWQTMHRMHYPSASLPDRPVPLGEMVRWIAGLGGFLGRKSDGEPGAKVLWRGLMRLHDIILGVLLLPPELVGND